MTDEPEDLTASAPGPACREFNDADPSLLPPVFYEDRLLS